MLGGRQHTPAFEQGLTLRPAANGECERKEIGEHVRACFVLTIESNHRPHFSSVESLMLHAHARRGVSIPLIFPSTGM